MAYIWCRSCGEHVVFMLVIFAMDRLGYTWIVWDISIFNESRKKRVGPLMSPMSLRLKIREAWALQARPKHGPSIWNRWSVRVKTRVDGTVAVATEGKPDKTFTKSPFKVLQEGHSCVAQARHRQAQHSISHHARHGASRHQQH